MKTLEVMEHKQLQSINQQCIKHKHKFRENKYTKNFAEATESNISPNLNQTIIFMVIVKYIT
jgi:hypothetical protein